MAVAVRLYDVESVPGELLGAVASTIAVEDWLFDLDTGMDGRSWLDL